MQIGLVVINAFAPPNSVSADDAESTALLNEALDIGYTFLDTAMVYGSGHDEQLIGKAAGHRRNEDVLATKCGLSRATGINGDPAEVPRSCNASLRRLGIDVIDLYYLHRVDPNIPIEDTVGTLSKTGGPRQGAETWPVRGLL